MSSGSRSKSSSLKLQIRWMIRRDIQDVLAIEQESFEFHWNEDDFLSCLRQRNCIGMIAETETRVVGFMVYELHKDRLHVLNFAVAADYRRLGVGGQMVDKLVNKLAQQRRQEIMLEVRESNLVAQKFFQQLGFKAVCVKRNRYEDSAEDAYVMQYNLDADPAFEFSSNNRLRYYRFGA